MEIKKIGSCHLWKCIHAHYIFYIFQYIKTLGPLEYILNTPSHHRVHHGRNPYCIDKNYAGTLIIWDRIFGKSNCSNEQNASCILDWISSPNTRYSKSRIEIVGLSVHVIKMFLGREKGLNLLQAVKTLIWVCTVCQLPFWRSLD